MRSCLFSAKIYSSGKCFSEKFAGIEEEVGSICTRFSKLSVYEIRVCLGMWFVVFVLQII